MRNIETYKNKKIGFYGGYIVSDPNGGTLKSDCKTLDEARAWIDREIESEKLSEKIKEQAQTMARELLKDNKIIIDLDIRTNNLKIKKIQVNRIY